MKVQLCIREDDGCYIGETTAIRMRTNIRELKGELVMFYGATKDEVINQVITVLRAKKLSGTIQLV